MVRRLQKGEFTALRIGETHLYVGPPPKDDGRKVIILAIMRGSGKPIEVGTFKNTVARDQFIELMQQGAADVDRAFVALAQKAAGSVDADGNINLTFGDAGELVPANLARTIPLQESTISPSEAP